MLCLIGMMVTCGIKLNFFSNTIMIVVIGYSVDFTAHIAQGYFCASREFATGGRHEGRGGKKKEEGIILVDDNVKEGINADDAMEMAQDKAQEAKKAAQKGADEAKKAAKKAMGSIKKMF